MKRRDFLTTTAVGTAGLFTTTAGIGGADHVSTSQQRTRKILIAGGGFNTAFIRYMATLTGKPRPKLLYSADRVSRLAERASSAWFRNCAPLNVEPSAQESFIASTRQTRGWEEVLLSVDGIVCSGGNTSNQQAIWKAQGIDVILKDAWDRGIVLGGASAGSLCWFEEGTTDSRPKELIDRQVPRISQGQSLAPLRCREGSTPAVPQADWVGADEARMGV